MSLYWPEANVAIDIIDDPGRNPFDIASHPDATVFYVTCAELMDPVVSDEIACALANCLGAELPPDTPEFRMRRRALHQTLFGGFDR